MASLMSGVIFVPIATLEKPRSGEAIVGAWWLVHPDYGAMFWRPRGKGDRPLPACNQDRKVCQILLTKLDPAWSMLEVRHIPVAFTSHAELVAARRETKS